MAKVLLGVSGGIAAYKAPELARLLVRAGHAVDVVLTEAATRLVSPAALAAVTRRPVYTSMWAGLESGSIDHVALAAEADAVVVAPATADFLARAATGRASDLLSACLLVTRAPILLAPAMNSRMWEHPFTRRNVATLSELPNVHWVGPESGELACGWQGPGRMAEPATIAAALEPLLSARASSSDDRADPGRPGLEPGPSAGEALPRARDLEGRLFLVTAGPTFEPLDPIRFIGNRSSGRMGQALAEAAARRGARVTLLRGPTALPPPAAGVELVSFETAVELRRELLARWKKCDALLMAAAVADYRPRTFSTDKLERGSKQVSLSLVPTPDILAEVGRRRGTRRRPVLVGFCVETRNLAAAAKAKLASKRCDLVVANLARDSIGLETTKVVVHRAKGKPLGPFEGPKSVVADTLLDVLVPLLS